MVEPLLTKFNYNGIQIVIISVIFVLIGAFSAGSMGFILDKTSRYTLSLKIIVISSTITMASSIILL